MADYTIVHRFAEINSTISIPDDAIGITVNIDPRFRFREQPKIINVCYLQPTRQEPDHD